MKEKIMKHIVKKFISLILVFAMSLAISVPGFAAEDKMSTNSTSKSTYVILTNNNTGHKFKVDASLNKENGAGTNGLSGNTKSQVLSFIIDKNSIQPYSSGTQTVDEWDDSISVHGYLRLLYTKTPVNGGGGNNVLLTNVNGRWDISDSGVSISDVELFYACIDPITYYSQAILKYPTGLSYSYNTGFSHAVQDSGGSTACGAHVTAQLHHGSSSNWTFEITNTLFNNYGLPDL
jgi:hypothetical protein